MVIFIPDFEEIILRILEFDKMDLLIKPIQADPNELSFDLRGNPMIQPGKPSMEILAYDLTISHESFYLVPGYYANQNGQSINLTIPEP
jgi:hypothetical protein